MASSQRSVQRYSLETNLMGHSLCASMIHTLVTASVLGVCNVLMCVCVMTNDLHEVDCSNSLF